MTTIFSDFFGDSLEVFMDDFFVFEDDFDICLAHLTKILQVCVRKRLVLSWEKSHFLVREGVVLRHLVSGKSLEVDKAKIEVIQNLPLSLSYIMRFTEFSWAHWLLLQVYTRLC